MIVDDCDGCMRDHDPNWDHTGTQGTLS